MADVNQQIPNSEDPDFPAARVKGGRPPKLAANRTHTKRRPGSAAGAKVKAAKPKGTMRGRRLTDRDKLTIVQVFASEGGNAMVAAEKLKISVDTLYRVLREHKAQTKNGKIEFGSIVAGELGAALTAKARLILSSFTQEDIAGMPASQRAVSLGIFTDKAIRLLELEQKEREQESVGAMPTAVDAKSLLAQIAQRVQAMPFLQVNMVGQGLLARAQELTGTAAPKVVEAKAGPVIDMDGNDVGTFLPRGAAEADTWAEQEVPDAPGDGPLQ
jgi:hypothetical protein